MAFSGKLASLFVEFTTKGAEELKQQIGSVKSEMEKIPKTVAAPKVAAAAQGAQAGAAAAGEGAAAGGAGAAAGLAALGGAAGLAASFLSGMVREGLAGTTIQERLNVQWTQLTRQIADIFLPVIQRVSDFFGSLLELTRPLFRAIGDVVESILRGLDPVIKMLTTVLKPLFSLLTTIVDIFGSLIGVVTDLVAVAMQPLVKAIELLAEGLAWLAEKIRNLFSFLPGFGKPSNRATLANVPGGFESVQESFRRVQQQALRTEIGKPPLEQQQLEELKQINQNTAGTTRKVGELKPAVV